MVTVSPAPTYASELFGEGHASPVYPADMNPDMDGNQDGTPVVTLSIPANVTAVADDPSTADTDETVAEVNHSGSAEITFAIHGGMLNANVEGLMWDADTATAGGLVPAPAAIASIVDGGRKGDTSITIKVEEAGTDGRSTTQAADGTLTAGTAHLISFNMPRLANVGALAGANPKDPVKRVWLSATSRIISGAFTDGPLAGVAPHHVTPVIQARDSVTLAISDPNTKTIAIDDDAAKGLTAFMSVKERIAANKKPAGFVDLATVTVTTRQESAAATAGTARQTVGYVQGTAGTDAAFTDAGERGTDAEVYNPKKDPTDAMYYHLFDLDGAPIDEGLRGNLMLSATGTRDLFNEDDMLFIDYDGDMAMGPGEEIAIDADMMSAAMGGALSIDPDKSDSFDAGGTGTFKVYYMPGGKSAINHGAMINLTATVDYSDPSAIDEAAAKTSTTLNFDGVGSPIMAYAIPHSTNGTGDKGNVRVRCEQPAAGAEACRVFAECWDDAGNRGFDEAPMIAANNVMVWSGAAIEGVTGLEPTSRLSCRVLAKGMVTVQQLTRDGNSGTLVNNTYVGDGNAGVMDIVEASEARIMGQIKDTH